MIHIINMKKLSFFKKVSIYFTYRNLLSKRKDELLSNNLRVDRAKRIYTVLNIPPESFEEPYNLRSNDINRLAEPFISEYVKYVSTFLNSKGFTELYRLYDVQKVDKYSYLVVIGFSLLDTSKFAKTIFYKIVPTILIVSTLLFLIIRHISK